MRCVAVTRYVRRDTRGELRFDVASGPEEMFQRLASVSHPSTGAASAHHARHRLRLCMQWQVAEARNLVEVSKTRVAELELSGRIDASEIKRLNFLFSIARSTRARTYQINALEVNCTALAGDLKRSTIRTFWASYSTPAVASANNTTAADLPAGRLTRVEVERSGAVTTSVSRGHHRPLLPAG